MTRLSRHAQYCVSASYLARTQRIYARYPSAETYIAMESAQRMRDADFARWWRDECLVPTRCAASTGRSDQGFCEHCSSLGYGVEELSR
jgi:hypothetical protein